MTGHFLVELQGTVLHSLRAVRLLAVLLVALAVVASDSAAAGEFRSLKVGFQAVGRVGCWLPAEASATGLPEGEAVELHITASDPRGNPLTQVAAQGVVDDEGSVELNGLVRFGRLSGVATVAIVAATRSADADTAGNDKPAIFCRTSLPHTEATGTASASDELPAVQTELQLWQFDVPFLLVVGSPAGIDELERNARAVTEVNPLVEPPLVVLRVAGLNDLPTRASGYDCVDHVLWSDDFDLSEQRFEALKAWILSGGHWVLASGATLPDLLASTPGEWLHDRFNFAPQPVPVRILSNLESFVSGAGRVPTFYDSAPMAVVQTEQALVLVRALEGPLVSRLGAGAGVVTFVSIELNRRPLSSWRSLPQLYETLILGRTITAAGATEARSARISSSGVTDLATQLMATVDVEPVAGRWSTWAVMAMVFGYLLLIGPVDYLLVVLLLKRPHLTWITFPLMVLAGIWGLASVKATSGGGAARLNQLHVMDILQDQDEQQIVVRSWMSLSSPDTRRADLSVQPDALEPMLQAETVEQSLSWAGRPEDVYGGMYRVGGVGLGRHEYCQNSGEDSNQPPLQSVPLLTDGSFEMLATWTAEAAKPLVESQLSVSGLGLLEGTVAHNLPGTVDGWIIVHGNRMYRPSRLANNLTSLQTGVPLDMKRDDVVASDLKAFLNGTRLIQKPKKDDTSFRTSTQIMTPYNPEGRDPMDILTMITLYNIAGGQSYVGLTQHQLRRMELSDSVRLNYALLLGRFTESVTEMQLDGVSVPAAKSETLVRLLVPVDRRPARRQGLTVEELQSLETPAQEAIAP